MQSNSGKGQSSVEYTIIYGLGMVVIILAIIVAWRMDAFTPENPVKGIAGFSQLEVTDHGAYLDSGSLVLAVRNDNGDVEINRVDANIEKAECYNSSAVNMAAGMETLMILRCYGLPDDYERGSYYRANVTITYTNIETGNVHYSKGNVWGGME